MQNFNILASLCSWAGLFEPYWDADLDKKVGFFRNKIQAFSIECVPKNIFCIS